MGNTASLRDLGSSTTISMGLHLLVLALLLGWSYVNPFRPNEIVFDQVEVIDNETFERLIEQTANAPQADEIIIEESATGSGSETADEVTAEVAVEETQSTPLPPVPDQLQEPIFNPNLAPEPQPAAPITQSAPETDNAAPETPALGTDLPAPPSRNVEQLAQIAQAVIAARENDTPQTPPATNDEPEEIATPSELDPPAPNAPQQDQTAPETIGLGAEIPTPPSRNVEQLGQIARAVIQAREANTPEVVPTTPPSSDVAPTQNANENTTSEPSNTEQATDSTQPNGNPAETDAPVRSAPANLSRPPSRPSDLTPVAATPAAAEPAAADPGAGDNAQNTNEPTAQAATSNEEPTIDDLLAGVLAEGAQDGATTGGARGLSRIEQSAMLQKINSNWNKSTLIDKDDYTRLVVVVRFANDAAGNLKGNIELIEPNPADNDFLIAYEAAKRAIIASMPLEMPADVDPEGIVWRLRFDPANDGVGVF